MWSPREAKDIADCVEWCGTQAWSSGKVAIHGISYYSMNQWQAAHHRPKHLAALCIWEGSSDYYRELPKLADGHLDRASPVGGRSADVQVYTRLIEGPYPNYEQVIPKDNDKTMVADKGALNAAVRRMAIVASDQTHRIRMSLGGASLKFSVESPDLGAANEELEVEYDGEPLEIGFNAQYLLELLRYMPTDEVRMTFKAPERAATMQPLGNEDTPDYLCLVMPLRLLS